MTRLDRQWRDARTLTDLGHATALWLEGGLRRHPNGYDTPAAETRSLIPTLAAANRAGYVTDQSQPGGVGPGSGRAWWEQRAAVDGWIADPRLLGRLLAAARRDGLIASTGGKPIVVTRRNGEPHTDFGGDIPPRHLRGIWRGVHPAAIDEIQRATHLALIDPAWGPSDRLWGAIDKAVR
ncbi:hypothetical protein [Streptomyces sp. MP131-18]|uniref:DUF6919 domain-containing protein n=1 Tax=Streptomyces sp. MP131-18 TaxID=1857892 RepID=UPI00117FB685|nr:hypothetical protein [Streptomyces sp. MP131-18]